MDPPPLNPPSPAPPAPLNPGTTSALHTQSALIRYRSCLALLLACPLLIALPPRRLNIYSVGLGGVWVFALDEVLGQNRRRNQLNTPPRIVAMPGVVGVGELDKEDRAAAQGGGEGGMKSSSNR